MKNNPEFNIQFVQLIEKYPQVYNYTLESYCNKAEIEKAWKEIGNKVNESGEACMEKWKILRGGLTRFLKHKGSSGSSSLSKKEYYLARYMKFIVPYLRSRTQKGNLQSVNCNTVETDTNCLQVENSSHMATVNDIQKIGRYNGETDEVASPGENVSCSNKEFCGPPSKRKSTDRFNSAFIDYIKMKKSQKNEETENADLLFFKSVLPLVQMLDNKKKIEFRVKMLNTLNEMLYGGNSAPQQYTTVTDLTSSMGSNSTVVSFQDSSIESPTDSANVNNLS